MRTPFRFLWKRVKALYHSMVNRVRHNAVTRGFQWSPEDEEDFWALVFLDELFD